MNITLERRFFGDEYTIGDLYIGGQWICHTMEPHCIDWSREKKVIGKTAIPEGRYRVRVGLMVSKGVYCPELLDVPHFSGIYIHTGNCVAHTRGCILVGYNEVKGLVIRSRAALDIIMAKMREAKEAGDEEAWIELKVKN